MKPARGTIFCRPVRTAETFAGGSIVLLADTRERWVGQQAEVVDIGPPAFCDDPDCEREHCPEFQQHPCYTKPGDWILVEPRLFVEISDGLWSLPQDSVLAVLTT